MQDWLGSYGTHLARCVMLNFLQGTCSAARKVSKLPGGMYECAGQMAVRVGATKFAGPDVHANPKPRGEHPIANGKSSFSASPQRCIAFSVFHPASCAGRQPSGDDRERRVVAT